MSGGVVERIVYAQTADGLTLAGVLVGPDSRPKPEVIVWIHGGLSNFYEPEYLAIGRAIAQRGYRFVTGNTRGHDAYALLRRGDDPLPGGSCFERFDESPADIAAWIGFATAEGASQVVLAGHSQGGAKAVNYALVTADSRVRALVLASPPAGVGSPPERVRVAESMVAEGRGAELMPPAQGAPSWNIISAQTVLSRDRILRTTLDLGAEEPPISRLSCPLLVLQASEDEPPDGWTERLTSVVAARVVKLDCDHMFSGAEERVAAAIGGWLAAEVEIRSC